MQQGALEEISAKSRDGTVINGFILKPPGYKPGVRYPTLLQIHGGPTAQYTNSFDISWQILAAQGFVVVGGKSSRQLGARRGVLEGDLRGLGRKGY